jgi:uncharacterized protein DUF222
MVLDQLTIAQIEGLDDSEIDPKQLSAVVDRLQLKFCQVVNQAKRQGDHRSQGENVSAVGWVSEICSMSRNSAADRLCVGAQIESLPKVAEALKAGEIGYQPVAVICHLNEQLAEKGDKVVEEDWVEYARKFSVKEMRYLAVHARHVVDPDGFLKDQNEDFEERSLHISQSGSMYIIDGRLDPVGGAALKTAIDVLSKRHAPDDERTPRQRRADALTEIVVHAMDEGKLPKRNGVRPHITVTTTLEGLKGELGAKASDLEHGMPVSSKTVERLSCDGCLSRVLMADSQVIDVGRATRAISPSQRRALRVRDKHCQFPGCDRPVSWTSPHHIEFWARGGPTNLPNLLSLCWFHHREVHEGGWQVVKAAQGFKFIPPERVVMRRLRGSPVRWAA